MSALMQYRTVGGSTYIGRLVLRFVRADCLSSALSDVRTETISDRALTSLSSKFNLVISVLTGIIVAVEGRIQATTTRRRLNNMSTQLPDRSLV